MDAKRPELRRTTERRLRLDRRNGLDRRVAERRQRIVAVFVERRGVADRRSRIERRSPKSRRSWIDRRRSGALGRVSQA